ncbi:hypothetical protein ES705_34361 [subsurface metagenome]
MTRKRKPGRQDGLPVPSRHRKPAISVGVRRPRFSQAKDFESCLHIEPYLRSALQTNFPKGTQKTSRLFTM